MEKTFILPISDIRMHYDKKIYWAIMGKKGGCSQLNLIKFKIVRCRNP